MSTTVIDIPPEIYKRLQEEARKAGKEPEALTRKLLEMSLSGSRRGPKLGQHVRFSRLPGESSP